MSPPKHDTFPRNMTIMCIIMIGLLMFFVVGQTLDHKMFFDVSTVTSTSTLTEVIIIHYTNITTLVIANNPNAPPYIQNTTTGILSNYTTTITTTVTQVST